MGDQTVLKPARIQEKLSQLPDWRHVLGALRTAYKCPSSAAAVELISAIGAIAEEANHHPDLDWRYDTVFLALASHDVGGITDRDTSLAHVIAERAAALGAQPHLGVAQAVQIAIDTPDPGQLTGFWSAALGYVERGDSLVDPHGRGPDIWFQQTPTPDSSRMHVDVVVPQSHSAAALERLAAAGADLDHRFSPSWVIATDAQGNRVCICTEAEVG